MQCRTQVVLVRDILKVSVSVRGNHDTQCVNECCNNAAVSSHELSG